MKWEIFESSFSPEKIDWEKGRLLKDRPHRQVWLFEDFVIKAFRKKLFQRDQARKEAELGLELAGFAPQVLAYGRKGSWRYVVTERIKGMDFEEFLCQRFPLLKSSQKKDLWDSFSQFLQGLIDRKIFQPDFHLQNVLVKERPSFKFYLLDLHRADRLSYDEKRLKQQFAYLLPPLLEYLSWWEIGRLTYFLSQVFPALKKRTFRKQVQTKAFALMRKHFTKREKKLKKNLPSTISKELPSPEEIFQKMVLIKNSRVTKTGYFPPEKPKFWIKAFVGKGPWKGKRAEKAFWGAYQLQNRGISTIIPLAYWKTKMLGGPLKGLIVYPYLPEVRRHWTKWWNNLPKTRQDAFLYRLIRFLWEMHERGISHGDAKISNFFEKDGRLGIFDLDAIKFYEKNLSKKERLKDLATLTFSLVWLLPPEEKEPLTEKAFRFYAFLTKSFQDQDLLRFRRLVEKRLTKRLAKERRRARRAT